MRHGHAQGDQGARLCADALPPYTPRRSGRGIPFEKMAELTAALYEQRRGAQPREAIRATMEALDMENELLPCFQAQEAFATVSQLDGSLVRASRGQSRTPAQVGEQVESRVEIRVESRRTSHSVQKS